MKFNPLRLHQKEAAACGSGSIKMKRLLAALAPSK
jgi:hypothetical protein